MTNSKSLSRSVRLARRSRSCSSYVHGEPYQTKHDEVLAKAIEHVRVCIVFAKMQMKRGKSLVFEHPASASTRHEPCMQKLLGVPGVDWQTPGQCQYGLVTKDPDGFDKPAKKPTRLVYNGLCLLEELFDGVLEITRTNPSWGACCRSCRVPGRS